METWALICNPTAGGFAADRLDAVQRVLRDGGVRCRVVPTTHAGHGLALGREVNGVARVAVYGGDGSLNEVADGLVGRGIPLVFLPGGTANVMAHETGLARDPVAAARQALAGRVVAVHPGVMQGRHFLLMAGFGFDALAVQGVSPGIKARLGRAAYVLAGLQALGRTSPPLRVTTNGASAQTARWVVVARAARYGGAFRIHPRAGLTRPELGLVTVRRGWVLPFLACNLALGLGMSRGGIALTESRLVRIETEGPVHVQVDGEYWGTGERFEVGVAEGVLPLCLPGGVA